MVSQRGSDWRFPRTWTLGVTTPVDRGLAVDWVSADATGDPASMCFPEETVFVDDGGTWDDAQIQSIR
ncbi:hypothetical protein ACIO6T_18860 [Streptomyces sp. NPDC087532]|uniref:hypothetical protein n=1 Tax=unclassified Streptomyces TaxID=2593676 RepID=UPI003318DC56